MAKKWGANINRHVGGVSDISESRQARIDEALRTPEAIRDLQTIADLLESISDPRPWAVNEAAASNRRWKATSL